MRVKDLAKFEAEYDTSHQDSALQTRGLFIRKFPVHSLDKLTLDEYVVGHHDPSFCNLVESGTKAWANIQAAPSFKFGIYFGRTKRDPTRKYRFTEKFGTTEKDAFAAVKAALLDLVALGAADSPDFRAIDANLLSQMFKAKILSLYYPERFLAMCSSEHLQKIAEIMGFRKTCHSVNTRIFCSKLSAETRRLENGVSRNLWLASTKSMYGENWGANGQSRNREERSIAVSTLRRCKGRWRRLAELPKNMR